MAEKKVTDIDRSIYDIRDEENNAYRINAGLTKETVLRISEDKNDPDWLRDFRLKSLEIYNNLEIPDWGPPIDELDMDNISTYVRPKSDMKASWEEVPDDIKDTFERLGIPQAERESLAGVGAQYDSLSMIQNWFIIMFVKK